ncbi:MAG: hypothetical protein AB9866_23145 [Syntrophobacteraceae bacterium]
MRIVIGETTNSGSTYRPDAEPVVVEGRLIEIRDGKNSAGATGAASGKVLVLLVPDGHKVPRGIESGEYSIYLRFVHRRHVRS